MATDLSFATVTVSPKLKQLREAAQAPAPAAVNPLTALRPQERPAATPAPTSPAGNSLEDLSSPGYNPLEDIGAPEAVPPAPATVSAFAAPEDATAWRATSYNPLEEDAPAAPPARPALSLEAPSAGPAPVQLMPGLEGSPACSLSKLRAGLGHLTFSSPGHKLFAAVRGKDGNEFLVLTPGTESCGMQATSQGLLSVNLGHLPELEAFAVFSEASINLLQLQQEVFGWERRQEVFNGNSAAYRVVLNGLVVEGELLLRPTNLCFPELRSLAEGVGLRRLSWRDGNALLP